MAHSLSGHAQRECDEVGDVTAGVGNCQVRRLGVCHKESNGIECEVLDSKGADPQFWKQDETSVIMLAASGHCYHCYMLRDAIYTNMA